VSGGSSGLRGVFVQALGEYVGFVCTIMRRFLAAALASARVLVTNLHNWTQPLIRYELTDRFTPAGLSPGGFLRASVDGRSDDTFRYAAASVHPFVIGAALLHAPAVREFQVRQTERGADIAAVTDGDLDVASVTAAVTESLRQAGLPSPQVAIRRVGALDRDPLTGKARRFIPLHPAG
jgi:phenylacetate-CoA ligase